MNNAKPKLREYLSPARIRVLAWSAVFWLFFWLLFVGLQHVQLPGLGGAAPLVAAVIAIAATLVLLSRLLKKDGTPYRDVGLGFTPSALIQFLQGLGLGLAVVAVMVAALIALTPLQVSAVPGSNIPAVLGASFLVLLALALMEEIVFRSYPLFKLREAFGIRPAIYITAIAFAFYHGFAFENLLGPGVWGLFFGWMAISTRSIALPTGFHLGLNWMQAILGEKPQYSTSIWELSIGPDPGLVGTETLGLLMQLALLTIGVVLIEILVARQNSGN